MTCFFLLSPYCGISLHPCTDFTRSSLKMCSTAIFIFSFFGLCLALARVPPNLMMYESCSQTCIRDFFTESGCTNESTSTSFNDCLCNNEDLERSIAICVGGLCGLVEANLTATLWYSVCPSAGADSALSLYGFMDLAKQASDAGAANSSVVSCHS